MTVPPQDFGAFGIKDADRSKGRPLVSGKGPGGDELSDYPLQSRPVQAAAQSTTLDVPSRETRMASIVCISPMGPNMLRMRLFD